MDTQNMSQATTIEDTSGWVVEVESWAVKGIRARLERIHAPKARKKKNQRAWRRAESLRANFMMAQRKLGGSK